MKKYIISFLITAFLFVATGCSDDSVKYSYRSTLSETGSYQEFKIDLDSYVPNQGLLAWFAKEKKALEKQGITFWHEGYEILPAQNLERVDPKFECNNSKSDCQITNLNYPDIFAEDFGVHYQVGESVYHVLAKKETLNDDDPEAEFCILKDQEQLFCSKMNPGLDGPIIEAKLINNEPAFVFLTTNERGESATNAFFKGETLNEKYGLKNIKSLFSFQTEYGFIAQTEGSLFVFFNGQKVSEKFSEIRTNVCCAAEAFPFEIYKNGILFFVGAWVIDSYFVEVDLNPYL